MKPHPIIHVSFLDSRMVSSLCNRIITDLASFYLPSQIPGLQRNSGRLLHALVPRCGVLNPKKNPIVT